jgi:hypothetical protein
MKMYLNPLLCQKKSLPTKKISERIARKDASVDTLNVRTSFTRMEKEVK